MWTPWYIAAVVFGILEILVCIFSYLFDNRRITLIFRICFDVIAIGSGICIYMYNDNTVLLAAIIVNSIQLIRDIIFLLKEDYKWAGSIVWLIIFEVIFLGSIPFTWAGPLSLLPTIAGIMFCVGLYINNQKICKTIVLVGEVAFIVYYAVLIKSSDLLTILPLIGSCTFFTSALVGLINILIKEKKNKEAI